MRWISIIVEMSIYFSSFSWNSSTQFITPLSHSDVSVFIILLLSLCLSFCLFRFVSIFIFLHILSVSQEVFLCFLLFVTIFISLLLPVLSVFLPLCYLLFCQYFYTSLLLSVWSVFLYLSYFLFCQYFYVFVTFCSVRISSLFPSFFPYFTLVSLCMSVFLPMFLC